MNQPSDDRRPVSTIADLETLDGDEVVEGYLDGSAGEPEPGNNRSRSYWHGWKNGASDRGLREIDSAQRALASEAVATGYLRDLSRFRRRDLP